VSPQTPHGVHDKAPPAFKEPVVVVFKSEVAHQFESTEMEIWTWMREL
jgi:hypothetical protein